MAAHPTGPDFQVGTGTDPAVGIAADGDFVVVWQHGPNDDGVIRSRAYEANGDSKHANPVYVSGGYDPHVATDAQGNSVVVWTELVDDAYEAVFLRRLNWQGLTVGPPREVDPGNEDYFDATVATLDAPMVDDYGHEIGKSVVFWKERYDDSDWDIHGRRFRADGTSESYSYWSFDTASTSAKEVLGDVALNPTNGDVVVVWTVTQSDDPDVSPGMYFYMHNFEDGDPAEDENGNAFTQQPKRVGPSDGTSPLLAMDEEGNFLIAWSEGQIIFGQPFSPDGTQQGDKLLLGLQTLYDHPIPNADVDVSMCGSEIVAVHQRPCNGYLHRWSIDGDYRGTHELGDSLVPVENPSVAMNPRGEFALAFEEEGTIRAWNFRHDLDTAGVMVRHGGSGEPTYTFHLRNSNDTGPPDCEFQLSGSGAGWFPLAGDWNRDGIDTVGVYDQGESMFYLWNSNDGGEPYPAFRFGQEGTVCAPVAGDWNGSGFDRIGLYDPDTRTFFLQFASGSSIVHRTFQVDAVSTYRLAPVAGDWDGDGIDTVGLYDYQQGCTFYLWNTHDGGPPDLEFRFPEAGVGWPAVAGDWDRDGIDTVGVYDQDDSKFYLRNTNDLGPANIVFQYNCLPGRPLMGDWDGPGAAEVPPPDNEPPTAADDSYSGYQDTPLVTDDPAAGLLANDTDPDGDPLNAILLTDVSHGTLVLNSDGCFEYTPHADFTGTDTFTYAAGDGTCGSNLATVTISILPRRVHPLSTMGLYDPTGGGFHLKNSNAQGGGADVAFRYGPAGNRGWIPLVGDWDGDGVDTMGLYDPAAGVFHLKNVNANPPLGADVVFRYGPRGNRGWQPLVGDFNGDGIDTVGLYDPAAGGFHLKNSNSAGGGADVVFRYGPRDNRGWTALVGDWNGDGVDSVGLCDPAAAAFHLKNSNASGGGADVLFRFGPAGAGWLPLTGDWDADGTDGVGLYAPNAGAFHLKNTNANPPPGANLAFRYGPSGSRWIPLAGDFDGPGSPLRAAGGEAFSTRYAAPLTERNLRSAIVEAFARWDAAGIEADFSGVEFVVTDLPGAMLGLATLETIYIDHNAAGHGWFVDPTPESDEEFEAMGPHGELMAVDPDAVDRMDLLTVVSHELGHVLGLEDLDPSAESLMSGALGAGLRRDPGPVEIDALLAGL